MYTYYVYRERFIQIYNYVYIYVQFMVEEKQEVYAVSADRSKMGEEICYVEVQWW